MKKILSTILMVCMVMLTIGNTVFAVNQSNENSDAISVKDAIIKDYREKLLNVTFSIEEKISKHIGNNVNSDENIILEIQAETVSELKNAGYEAYDVNSQSFKSVELALNTDLTEAGLNPNGKYIILVEGEKNDNEVSTREAVSSSFTHVYNGTTYTLRWMTVYATDDPLMKKADSKNIIKNETSRNAIINCIDTGISAYLSAIPTRINWGTIASLVGFTIEDFAPSMGSTMTYQAATEWTRRYAQVWNSYDNAWQFGSCVEEVSMNSKISGYYYNSNTLDYVDVYKPNPIEVRYSPKFNNFDWRKNYAVIGYLNSYIYWDSAGDVEYEHGNVVVIRHRHNF